MHRLTPCPPAVNATLISFALLVSAPSAYGLIYECRDANDRLVYTDGTDAAAASCTQRKPYTPRSAPVIGFIPLSDAEQQQLQNLRTRAAQANEQREATRLSRQQEQLGLASARQRLCEQARSGLAALLAQRKSGYTLQQERALEDRERVLKAQKQTNC